MDTPTIIFTHSWTVGFHDIYLADGSEATRQCLRAEALRVISKTSMQIRGGMFYNPIDEQIILYAEWCPDVVQINKSKVLFGKRFSDKSIKVRIANVSLTAFRDILDSEISEHRHEVKKLCFIPGRV